MIKYQVRPNTYTKEVFSMIKSIQHFEEVSTGVFEKLIGEFCLRTSGNVYFQRWIWEL